MYLRLGLVLLASILLSSCEVEEVTLVELRNVEIERLEKKEMYMDVKAVLNNPNAFNIKVKESDLDLYMSDRYIGKANLENSFTLKSGTEQEYDLKIKATGDKLNAQLLPIMFTAALTGQVNVKLKGTITGRVFLISRSVKVDIEETVSFKNKSN